MGVGQEYYRKLFFISVAIGALMIFFVNYQGYDLNFQLSVLLVMIVYVLLYTVSDKEGAFRNQFADSVYYLGFIFTLISLGVSLLLLKSADDLKPVVVLSSFGVALSTTIFGLTVRAYYTQFSGGTEEELRDANHELVETAREFSLKLSRFSQDIDTSHNLIEKNNYLFLEGQKKHLDELYETIIADIKNGISGSIGQISHTVNDSLNILNTNVKSLNKVSENGILAMNKNVDLLNEGMSRHGTVFNNFGKLIEAENGKALKNYQSINDFAKSIQSQLSEMMGSATMEIESNVEKVISEELKSFERLIEVLGGINNAMQVSTQSIDSFSDSATAMSAYSNQMKEVVGVIKNLNVDTSVVSNNFAVFQKVMQDINEKMLSDIKDVQSTNGDLQEELQKSVILTNKMHNAIVQSANEMVSKLNNA